MAPDSPARSASGNIRALKQMSDAKFEGVLIEMLAYEQEDPEAFAAVQAEAERRGMSTASKIMAAPLPEVPKLKRPDLRPMLAVDSKTRGGLPTGDDWIIEPKLDGIRAMWWRHADGVKLIGGRNGKDHSGEAPYIEETLLKLPVDTILDAELVTDEGNSARVRSNSTRSRRAASTWVFDVLRVGGVDVSGKPWTERRQKLKELSASFDPELVHLVPYVDCAEADGMEAHEAFVKAGMEGSMAKRKDAVYRQGSRTVAWVKHKPQETTEAIVLELVGGKGKNNTEDVGSLKIKLIETGAETSCGSPESDWEKASEMVGKMIEIQHYGWQRSGKVRHPGFRRMRPDRDPVEEQVEANA